MEILDIVDENGEVTGKREERDTVHEKGLRHRTAHVWVVRIGEGKAELLLQKRAEDKESFPGCYDTSSAGHIPAGEEPVASAVRELGEELGIEAEEKDLEFIGLLRHGYEKVFHGKMFRDSEVTFVYALTKPVDIKSMKLQKEEVDSVRWFEKNELERLIGPPRDERVCVPSGGFRLISDWIDMKMNSK